MAHKTLHEEIKDFQRYKKIIIPVVLVLGVIGLFLPVLPGIALLLFGFILLFPRQGENILRKIRQTLNL